MADAEDIWATLLTLLSENKPGPATTLARTLAPRIVGCVASMASPPLRPPFDLAEAEGGDD